MPAHSFAKQIMNYDCVKWTVKGQAGMRMGNERKGKGGILIYSEYEILIGAEFRAISNF